VTKQDLTYRDNQPLITVFTPTGAWLFAGAGLWLGLGPVAIAQASPDLDAWMPSTFAPAISASMATAAKPAASAMPKTAPPPAKASAIAPPTLQTMPAFAPTVPRDAEPTAPVPPAAAAVTVAASLDATSASEAIAETVSPPPQIETVPTASELDVEPQIIEESPVLQRWLEEVPDVATDIKYDPAFRTRLRVGYAHFPSTDHTGGIYVGIQDAFIGRTPLTISAEYASNTRGDRELIGIDAQYYVLPLGWYGNVAPVLGYRSIDTPQFNRAGVNVGLRIILIPSRTGSADLSLTQTWVSPGTEDEVGLTTFSAGYAVTRDLRIGTDIQTQNTRDRQDSRVSLLVEWML